MQSLFIVCHVWFLRYKQQLEEVLNSPELQEKINQLFKLTKFLEDMGINGIKSEGYHGAMGILNIMSCHVKYNYRVNNNFTIQILKT